MEEETIEEAAERMSIGIREEGYKDRFIEGAIWMQERMEKLKDFNTWKEWKNKQ